MENSLAIVNSFTAACSLVAAFATLLLAIHKAKPMWAYGEALAWER